MKRFMGIDVGSVSIKAVIIEGNNIIKSYYTKNHGLIPTIKEVIANMKIDNEINGVGITGSGRNFISKLIGGDIIESEVIAHYVATISIYPDVKTIFDIGGEDCKLMIINNRVLTAFYMNRDCGGGTGAMIESIANRMGIPLDQIGDVALKSDTEVPIPSKCGIFAQSSVVSKLNYGIPTGDIMMGVCRGLVGNYFTMLAKGVRLNPPYVFQGATARNKALHKCFEDELQHEVIIPKNPGLMGAIGMAIITKEEMKGDTNFKGFNVSRNNFETRTFYGSNCTNKCEISKIYENGEYIGSIGNRCEKCIK